LKYKKGAEFFKIEWPFNSYSSWLPYFHRAVLSVCDNQIPMRVMSHTYHIFVMDLYKDKDNEVR